MKKTLRVILAILFVLTLVIIVALHLFMQPKTQTAINKDFEKTTLLAPTYKGLVLKSGKKISYLIAENKDKPIFFMVHGSPGSAADFLGFFKNEFLRQHYEIIAIDRLGFGISDNNPEPSIQKQSESIIELIETLNLDQREMVAFSHSYGVPIMLNISNEYPDWFQMNFYAGGATSSADEKQFFFNPIIDFFPIKAILPKAIVNSNDEKLTHANELKNLEKIYSEYDLPSVFIHGKKDKLVDFKNQISLKNLIKSKNVEFLDLEDQGHVFPLMDADYTVGLLKDYLEN